MFRKARKLLYKFTIETINQSGVVVNNGTAHSPIFSTSKLNYDLKPNKKEKITQYYSFSNRNTDSFVRKLEENYDSLIGDDPSNPTNFSTFFEKYKEYLDDTCKLAVPKKTVRNIINNPWITDSIISAIDKNSHVARVLS